jgi:hypothetical protein
MTESIPGNGAVREAIAERIARELFHADVLEGRTELSAAWEQVTEHERDQYLAEARAALRRNDAVAASVARHRAQKAAEKELGPALNDIGREGLKRVLRAALSAHHAHLQGQNTEQEVREQLSGLPATRTFAVLSGGRDQHEPERRFGHPVERATHHEKEQ